MTYQITASIVAYRNSSEMLRKAIESFLNTTLRVKLYLVDNSPTDDLRKITNDERVEYIFNNANLGFGRAHNIAMRKAMEESSYHLVLNPDVYFGPEVLGKLFDFMEEHKTAGQVMPKVIYPSGNIQRLCKLLPTPIDLFLRRFIPWWPGAEARNRRYELIETGYDRVMNIPNLSGCFMFFRTSALKVVGLFDERIFMYVEDTDLTRRVHLKYETLFFPGAQVSHHFDKGSYKSFKLMMYNIHGALIYFSKWGWFFDRQRREINKKVLTTYIR